MTCPRCASSRAFEITSFAQAEGVYLCGLCGYRFSNIVFRPHRYSPPDLVLGPLELIYCGPPAPYPAVPTPADILRGAGLDPWLTLDGGGDDHAG